ncbi:MAG TPA: kelch repeat-containing protein [Acidobacteriota bacterium]|nr:kelch repeat-containing protein [Acidobacteriota bacterium]
MNESRERFTAVRLFGGNVFIAGGYDNRYLKTAEIYNPSTGTFSVSTNDMLSTRSGAISVLLQSGTVLIAGGYNGNYLSSVEIYDPTTQTFTSTASMTVARQDATATRLSGGKILIAGGFNGAFLNSAELYTTSTSTFAGTAGVMADPREGHTATVLSDGRVLITGGCNNSNSAEVKCDNFLSTAEIYDPTTDSFSQTGSMSTPRYNHTATALPDGTVLVVGGSDGTKALASAEIYDPDTGEFSSAGSLSAARKFHTASVLPDGKVLIAGGEADQPLSSIEIFDPSSKAFTTAVPMSVPRSRHAAVELADGKVLLVGGENASLLYFDVNYQIMTDNVSPNIVFSPDSKTGFVSYAGSGVVLAFSADTGAVVQRIATGGNPAFIKPLPDGKSLAVVSVLDNKIFVIDMPTLSLKNTFTYSGYFGFGSLITLSPDGSKGYISSTQTGEVIKFDTSTFSELGRLKGMTGPAQITITKDGNTLLIVDVMANEVVVADASSMTTKYKVTPLTNYPAASFTIANKAVLNADETLGIIASQDSNTATTCSTNALFVFMTSTGTIVNTKQIACYPGDSMLLPRGDYWVVLGQSGLSVIPTVDSNYDVDDDGIDDNYANGAVDDYSNDPSYTVSFDGSTLGSANLVLSKDQQFVYYGVASIDAVYQQDVNTKGVVGSYPVGDYPDVASDQAAAAAITPDWTTLAVVNFTSNEVSLLNDETVARQTKYVSQNNQFTGLSLVNLSEMNPANVTITLLTSHGDKQTDTRGTTTTTDDLVNPVTVQVAPNAQESVDIAQLFTLTSASTETGRVLIESDQPDVVGFSAIGTYQSNFFDPILGNMVGVPLTSDYRKSLHSFVIPEMPQETGSTVEFNFVNPNYNGTSFDVFHHATDGTVMRETDNQSLAGSNRETKAVSDFAAGSALGLVVVAGGYDAGKTLNNAYRFTSGGGTFDETTGILTTPRYGHTSTFLPNQQILIAGGRNLTTVLKNAEVYYPDHNYFLPAPGTMNVERYRHTATRLPNGKVLIAGGQNARSYNKTAELFDPTAGSFTLLTALMTSPRDSHTATLMSNGNVLLAGGIDGISIASSAEVYDPNTSTFQATGSMNTARVFHTAVGLPDGRVLIAGGYNGNYLNSAEIYDPSTGLFTPTSPMVVERSNHTATLLSNGTVLIVGGRNSSGYLDTGEIYDPSLGTFALIESTMTSTRYSHTATLLNDDVNGINNRVLIVGGYGYNSADAENNSTYTEQTLDAAELYNPATQQFSVVSGRLTKPSMLHTATLMSSEQQGYLRVQSDIGLLFTEIYDEGGAPASLNGIDVDNYAGITKIYSPKFVIASSSVTQVNIINSNQNSGATVTLTLHGSDGSVLSQPVTFLLAENAQLKGNLWDVFKNDPSLLNQVGWLEVTSSVDRVVGTVTFTDATNTFLATFELMGTPLSNFLYPLIAEDSTYQTQIALLNTGSQVANASMELWGPAGTLDGFVSLPIAPGTSIAKTLSEIFPGMQAHRPGNVRIKSDQPIFSFGTLSTRQPRFVTSLPPVPYPGPVLE